MRVAGSAALASRKSAHAARFTVRARILLTALDEMRAEISFAASGYLSIWVRMNDDETPVKAC
jgi:hypothetical protein